MPGRNRAVLLGLWHMTAVSSRVSDHPIEDEARIAFTDGRWTFEAPAGLTVNIMTASTRRASPT